MVAFPHLGRVNGWRTEEMGLWEHGVVCGGGERQQPAELGVVEDMGRVGELTGRNQGLMGRGRGEFVDHGSRSFSVTKDTD